MSKDIKILLPGGAGLVGQNLVARLKSKGYKNIIVYAQEIDQKADYLNITDSKIYIILKKYPSVIEI